MQSDPASAASAAALTLAVAAAVGIVSQSAARALRLPGIVLLLAVGVLLGPDVLGLVQPATLGSALPQVVGFAVAVILFEGGMNLDVRHFADRHRSIRRLVTQGALLTAVGGTLAARFILDWQWREAALFGCLVIVTGPTVVTPLVRRFKLVTPVSTILEAEGVLIDAVGAVTAVVALEIALEPSGDSLKRGLVGIAARLGGGALLGVLGGLVLAGLLRMRALTEGLGNVLTLALVWALYQGSEALLHESGVAAVTVAGLLLGNMRTIQHRELLEFNDQLTVMLIGMLFVLLAAGVRLADVWALGWPGLLTVAVLVLVVRPLTVLTSTVGCNLTLRQRLFVAWIGPRGIIAAAVASLFASELERAGVPGGQRLQAMVFLVIAVTVVLAGLSGGLVARLLGVSRPPRGWLLLGANALACTMARLLRGAGEEVACIDSSVDHCSLAGRWGIEVIHGNALEEETLLRAHVELRAGVAAVTPNDEINLLFLQRVKHHARVERRLAVLVNASEGITAEMLHASGARLLFAADQDVELWSARLRQGEASVEVARAHAGASLRRGAGGGGHLVPLTHQRGSKVTPVADDLSVRDGDEVTFVIAREHRDEAVAWLDQNGWALQSELELHTLASQPS